MKLLTLIIGALLAQSSTTFETSLGGRVEALGTNAPVPYAEVVLAPMGGSVDGYRPRACVSCTRTLTRRPGL
jgi:hypothetical protein